MDLEKRQEWLNMIAKEVGRLEKILGDLINFNRTEKVCVELVDPNKLIEHILKANEANIRAKKLKPLLRLSRDVGEIPLDPDRFQQVVRNLLTNAIEASPEGQTIVIHTGLSAPGAKARSSAGLDSAIYFEMKIRNQGKAISLHQLEEIFSPFFTTKERGTGLGLTLTRKIIEDHGGSVSVKSGAEGTLFTVWLPRKSNLLTDRATL